MSELKLDEPWRVTVDKWGDIEVWNCNDKLVIEFTEGYYDINVINRIVACVNACKNIDTETLIKAAKFDESKVQLCVMTPPVVRPVFHIDEEE
jgi:hypothetical protein